MQTTINSKRLDPGQFKALVVAAGVAAAVLAGAATFNATRDDETATQLRGTASTARWTSENTHFMEMNALPEVAPQVLPNYRLLDMNVLPDEDIHAAQATVATQSDYRFTDINVLPGDDTQLSPSGADGRPY